MTVVAAPRVVTGGSVHEPAAVEWAEGRVVELRTGPAAARSADVVLEHGLLAPGLVDAQVNGYFGVDFSAANPAEWSEVCRRLPSTGVTAYAPTFITAPMDSLVDALTRAAAARTAWCQSAGEPDDSPGAEPVGVHLEGPFLSDRRRGAHNAAHLLDATTERVDRLLTTEPGILVALTLAPERPGCWTRSAG